MTRRPPYESRWLFGPARDLLFGCNLWYLLFFGVLLSLGPGLRVHQPLWLAPLLILLISTPHYGATLVRAYEKRDERRTYALFTVWSTLGLLGLFGWGLANAAVGTFLFTLYLTWSPWHYTAQNYGIALTFLGRRELAPSAWDKRWLRASFVLSYLVTFFVMHRADGNARGWGEGGIHLARLGIPETIADLAIPGLALGYAVALGVSGWGLLRRGSLADLLPVGLIALSQCLWFTVPDAVRAFGLEGPEAVRFDQRAIYFNWVVVAHATQYLWVTSYYARAGSDWRGAGRYFSKTLLAGNLVWMAPTLVFAPQILGGDVPEFEVGFLVAALVNLHHFVIDGAIWKLRKSKIADVLIRSGAAFSTAVSRSRSRAPWVWGGAALLLALALVEFGAAQVAIPRLLAARDPAAATRVLDGLAWVGRDSALLRFGVAHAWSQAGRHEDARRALQRSAELTPAPEPHLGLAEIALGLGDPEEARRQLDRAAALGMGRSEIQAQVATLRAELTGLSRGAAGAKP